MLISAKICSALALSAAFGATAALPSAGQTTLTAGGSVVYGTASSLYPAAFGTDGFVLFDTTASNPGKNFGNFQRQDTFTPATGDNPAAQTLITQPVYVSGFSGFTVDHAAGYGYPDIATGRQSGLVGARSGNPGGSIFSFTVGAAKSFTFDVFANYSEDSTENPGSVTLTGSGSVPAATTNRGSGAARATAYLFSIANAAPGETFTVSTDRGYISGAGFSSASQASAAPEPSQAGLLVLLGAGLGGALLNARRRRPTAA